jgi:hypothetical protein
MKNHKIPALYAPSVFTITFQFFQRILSASSSAFFGTHTDFFCVETIVNFKDTCAQYSSKKGKNDNQIRKNYTFIFGSVLFRTINVLNLLYPTVQPNFHPPPLPRDVHGGAILLS